MKFKVKAVCVQSQLGSQPAGFGHIHTLQAEAQMVLGGIQPSAQQQGALHVMSGQRVIQDVVLCCHASQTTPCW